MLDGIFEQFIGKPARPAQILALSVVDKICRTFRCILRGPTGSGKSFLGFFALRDEQQGFVLVYTKTLVEQVWTDAVRIWPPSNLLPGWGEVLDPDTGEPRYVNEMTDQDLSETPVQQQVVAQYGMRNYFCGRKVRSNRSKLDTPPAVKDMLGALLEEQHEHPNRLISARENELIDALPEGDRIKAREYIDRCHGCDGCYQKAQYEALDVALDDDPTCPPDEALDEALVKQRTIQRLDEQKCTYYTQRWQASNATVIVTTYHFHFTKELHSPVRTREMIVADELHEAHAACKTIIGDVTICFRALDVLCETLRTTHATIPDVERHVADCFRCSGYEKPKKSAPGRRVQGIAFDLAEYAPYVDLKVHKMTKKVFAVFENIIKNAPIRAVRHADGDADGDDDDKERDDIPEFDEWEIKDEKIGSILIELQDSETPEEFLRRRRMWLILSALRHLEIHGSNDHESDDHESNHYDSDEGVCERPPKRQRMNSSDLQALVRFCATVLFDVRRSIDPIPSTYHVLKTIRSVIKHREWIYRARDKASWRVGELDKLRVPTIDVDADGGRFVFQPHDNFVTAEMKRLWSDRPVLGMSATIDEDIKQTVGLDDAQFLPLPSDFSDKNLVLYWPANAPIVRGCHNDPERTRSRFIWNANEIKRVHDLHGHLPHKGTIIVCPSNYEYTELSRMLQEMFPHEKYFGQDQLNKIKAWPGRFIAIGMHKICTGMDYPERVGLLVFTKYPRGGGDDKNKIKEKARTLVRQAVGRIRRTTSDQGVVMCLGGKEQAEDTINDIITMDDAKDCRQLTTLDEWPFGVR